MDDIDVQIVSTGSIGNAVFLNGQVLIDCGVPFSKLADAGVVEKVKYVFLTHQHHDHLNAATIKRLAEARPSVRLIFPQYLCKPLAQACNTSKSNLFHSFLKNSSIIISPLKWYQLGGIKFCAVPLHHDVPNVGWKIHFPRPQGIYKVIYATDTASMDGVTARDYDLYLIEANYDRKEIVDRIKAKRTLGQYVYEERVLKTHLSKQQANEFIDTNSVNHIGGYIYLHGHEDR